MRSFLIVPFAAFLALPLAAVPPRGNPPFLVSQVLFPPEHLHNHGSCIVECPNGDLLACWYNGSGERKADDVKIEGARLRKGDKAWGPRFQMADQPDFPDTNPCMFIDPKNRLWLFWQTIVANEWHTAVCRYKIASPFEGDGPPKWESNDLLILKPGPEFAEAVTKQCDADLKKVDQLPVETRDRAKAYLQKLRQDSADKFLPRMGWMTRAHPYVSEGKRLIVPLYSDGFNFSLMAISDDWGGTWKASTPLTAHGGVQPSIARRKDGTLVTYMRDNGPPPKRLMTAESKDQGMTWSPVVDSAVPNPGSGAEVVTLRNGNWALIHNDTEKGRHSLAVSISDDDGKSWKWTRHLERDEPGPDAGSFSYPSLIEAKDGSLHATYSYVLNGTNVKLDEKGGKMRECIKHARFNVEWVKAGD